MVFVFILLFVFFTFVSSFRYLLLFPKWYFLGSVLGPIPQIQSGSRITAVAEEASWSVGCCHPWQIYFLKSKPVRFKTSDSSREQTGCAQGLQSTQI